jgi:NAD(P)-dependent dehydrogenase (short-subunit alcohol dehydrogenase family)
MTAKAGWYPNPSDGPPLRWWDGEKWTDAMTYPVPTADVDAVTRPWKDRQPEGWKQAEGWKAAEDATSPSWIEQYQQEANTYNRDVQRQKVADSMDGFIDHAAHSFGGQIIVLIVTAAVFFMNGPFFAMEMEEGAAMVLSGVCAIVAYRMMSRAIFGGFRETSVVAKLAFAFVIFLTIMAVRAFFVTTW